MRLVACAALLLSVSVARADDTVDALRAEGLPTALVEAKLREARLKNVPEIRVRPVVEKLATSLRTADRIVGSGEGREAALSEVARTLALGVPEQAIRDAVSTSDRPVVQARAATAVGALVSTGVAPQQAARVVQRLVAAGLSDRLHTVRAALEQLEASGLDANDAAGRLAADASQGKAPLSSANERARERESRANPRSTTSNAGGNSGQGDANHGNDRERGAGRGNTAKEEKPDKGNNGNGKGNGKP